MIQNFGGGELIAIIIIALVVLGPDRLPEMARSAGRMLHKFRTMTSGLQSQVRDVMDDPSMQPLRELGEFAARPRQKLSEYALEAEAEERSKAEKASLDQAAVDVPETAPVEPAAPVDMTGLTADGRPTALEPAPADPPPAEVEPPVSDSPPPAAPAPTPAAVPVAEATTSDVIEPEERESA